MPKFVRDKIATIVPQAHFGHIRMDNYFMALVHAALLSERYKQFFTSRGKDGRYVILDNSSVELGAPMENTIYVNTAVDMMASEICLPDALYDVKTTIKTGDEMLDYVTRTYQIPPFNIMAIPQGKSKKEWVSCAESMMDRWKSYITTIGISCRYTEMFGSRIQAVNMIYDAVTDYDMYIHMLGNYLPPHQEVAPLLLKRRVRGVDSSTPCVFTQYSRRMYSGEDSPPHHKLDFITDKFDEKLLAMNIQDWRTGCGA